MPWRSEYIQPLLQEAILATKHGQYQNAWDLLSKAHIISQPSAALHTKVHWYMLLLALKTSDPKEIMGQIFRLFLAAPGSLLGLYPKGNTGRSNVSAFQEMETPSDLKELLQKIE